MLKYKQDIVDNVDNELNIFYGWIILLKKGLMIILC